MRNFLPPQAQEPEIFLLDKLIQDGIDIKESTAPSSAGSSKFDCKYAILNSIYSTYGSFVDLEKISSKGIENFETYFESRIF